MHDEPVTVESIDLDEKAFADFYKNAKGIVMKKKEERKPEKAMDAGAKARRVLKRKEHAKYVSGSTENVPDDIKDHYEVSEGAAWTKKSGKNPEGGLNEKGRKSYERENPGSDLKAPQPGGGPRKRSFCARMGGVKGPMKDEKGRPTRKALALRKWKC